MDREEFERMKEAEKEHLRKMKALKEQLRSAQRTARLRQAVDGITRARDTPDLDASIEAVQLGAIESEVRLDMALESAADGEPAEPVVDEEEARRLRAEALVRQMKTALGTPGLDAGPSRASSGRSDSTPPSSAGPDKTIGRTADTPETPDADELPEKTIGRVGGRRRRDADG